MDLIKITDLTNRLDISSRSLRYYEQIGLIQSIRSDTEKYRYYDVNNVERLKQIMVLRKMQIPIKDIIRIYESEDMSVVVETFVERINAIDEEVSTLSEMKRITNEFLQTMIKNGIKKISALPLLYDEMEKELAVVEEHKPISFEELTAVSEKLVKPLDWSIIDLPPMRVLTSCLKPDMTKIDFNGFSRFIQTNGLSQPAAGNHQQFEFQFENGDVLMVKIPDDYVNESKYLDYTFIGGLFATVNVYLDEDLGQSFRSIIRELDVNPYYQFAYCYDGTTRHPTLIESLISPDSQRELVSMLVPIKKRLPDASLFDKPEEITDITIKEIETANTTLWTTQVALDKLIPVKPSGGYVQYEILPTGEALFATYVSTRYLSTNVEVKLPFRVDLEFKYDKSPPNTDEGIRIYFGNCMFAVNQRNNPDPVLSEHAIEITQPVFENFSVHKGVGHVKKGEYNTVSWIIGENHLAVLINGEVRFCAKNMPYMKTDFQSMPKYPIMFNGGGDMPITVRSVNVSQLAATKKTKIKNGKLTMITKQSNNLISGIETYCVGERGENFAFDGACEQLMRILGEKDFDYWLIAGITGDCFAQVYPKNHVYYSDRYCVSDYNILYDNDCSDFIDAVFEKLGYDCTYVTKEKIIKNKEMYRQTLMAYIDNGIPVIQFNGNYNLICGYEESGNILISKYPCSDHFDKFVLDETYFHVNDSRGWIFIGDKKEQKNLADIYRKAVLNMSEIMTTETEKYCFGAKAFCAWADDIENGFYDGKTQEEVDLWGTHTSFVCDFETIAAKSGAFLSKALELNPDLIFIPEIIKILGRQGAYANGGLEDLSGGFNVTLATLQDKEKRKLIAERLRKFANNMDKVVEIIKGKTTA